MSSKALASALLSYGADMKIKNILMEIFFSVLPPTIMSAYELIDHRDELVVDLLFQYVKSTMKQRNEYYIVAQSLMLETYPDLKLEKLTPAQISLLADLAVKRVVYRSVKKINSKIYVDPPADVSKFDKTIKKLRFIESLTTENDSSVSRMIRVENTGKLSFLSAAGTPRKISSVADHFYFDASDVKFCRITSGAQNLPITTKSSYQDPVYCLEPYIRVQVKDYDDIILCTKEMTGDEDPKKLALLIGALTEMVMLFSTGEKFVANTTANPFSYYALKNIKKMAGKQFVCSVDDLSAYWTKILGPIMYYNTSNAAKSGPVLDAVFQNISLGVRCSVDTVSNNQYWGDPPEQEWADLQALREKGFAEKTLYYLEPVDKTAHNLGGVYNHFTSVLAFKEQKYEPNKINTVIEEGKKFNNIHASQVFGEWSATSTIPAHGLITELLRTKEFDALIKSVFVPAMLYNTISLVPNIEIGRDLIPMMRQRGVFKGLDDVLNGMFSSLLSYLTGDFPWGGCGDLTKLL